MTTQRLSALASLLLEDEATKIQAFSILKSKLQAPFVEEFTKKYDYSQEDALILFKKSCEMLFEQYIWNPHLLADDSSRKKGDKYEKMRNTFFYYFLRITQGISKPEEWDMLASLVEIALHEKLYFEPYLDKEANVNEDRGILLGNMNRKQVCFDYLYEKHKNHVTQYIQNNFSRIPKEDAKSIRNDSFIKANQLINAEDCLVEEFRRIWFCISWLINHPNKSYKDFVFVNYVKNIAHYDASNKIKTIPYKQNILLTDRTNDVSEMNLKLSTPVNASENISESKYLSPISFQKKKEAFAQLLKVEEDIQILLLSIEKQGLGSWLPFLNKKREKGDWQEMPKGKLLVSEYIMLIHDYFSALEGKDALHLIAEMLLEEMISYHKTTLETHYLHEKGKGARTKLSNLAKELNVSRQTLSKAPYVFYKNQQSFLAQKTQFLLSKREISANNFKKEYAFIRKLRLLIEYYNTYYEES